MKYLEEKSNREKFIEHWKQIRQKGAWKYAFRGALQGFLLAIFLLIFKFTFKRTYEDSITWEVALETLLTYSLIGFFSYRIFVWNYMERRYRKAEKEEKI